jgi:hypothetical protein
MGRAPTSSTAAPYRRDRRRAGGDRARSRAPRAGRRDRANGTLAQVETVVIWEFVGERIRGRRFTLTSRPCSGDGDANTARGRLRSRCTISADTKAPTLSRKIGA